MRLSPFIADEENPSQLIQCTLFPKLCWGKGPQRHPRNSYSNSAITLSGSSATAIPVGEWPSVFWGEQVEERKGNRQVWDRWAMTTREWAHYPHALRVGAWTKASISPQTTMCERASEAHPASAEDQGPELPPKGDSTLGHPLAAAWPS